MKRISILLLFLVAAITESNLNAGCDIFQAKRIYMQTRSADDRKELLNCILQSDRNLTEDEAMMVLKKFLTIKGITNDRSAREAIAKIVKKVIAVTESLG